VGAVAVEVLVEELLESLEVRLQPGPHLVGEVAAGGAVRLRGRVEEGVRASRDVAGRRRHRRVEIDVEGDRAAVLGPEAGQLAQAVQADRGRRHIALCAKAPAILSLRCGTASPSDTFSKVEAHFDPAPTQARRKENRERRS
jgi:hypothetical protein